MQPSSEPSQQPTAQPSNQPSFQPSKQPAAYSTQQPSNFSINPTLTFSITFADVPSTSRLKILPFIFGTSCTSSNILHSIDLSSSSIGMIVSNRGDSSSTYLINGNINKTLLSSPQLQINNYTLFAFDNIMRSLAMIGDINGDGIIDVAVGDPVQSNVYIFAGDAQSGFVNMSCMITMKGDQYGYLGFSVAGAGDMNGDGLDDMIVGMPYYVDANIGLHGGSVVMFGSKTYGERKSNQIVYVANITGSTESSSTSAIGMVIVGSSSVTQTGIAVTGLGDFNRDGFDDIAISSIVRTMGIIYIIYGSSILPSKLYLDGLRASQGMKIISSFGSYAGISLSDAGDVNGDGYDDLLIGSVPYTNGFGQQKSYVIFGRSSVESDDVYAIDGDVSIINLALFVSTNNNNNPNGIVLNNGGIVVSGVGDMNADGIDDMMIVNYIPELTSCNVLMFVYPEQRTAHPIIFPTSSPTIMSSKQFLKPTLQPSRRSSLPTTSLSPNSAISDAPNLKSFVPSRVSSSSPELSSMIPTIASSGGTTLLDTPNPSSSTYSNQPLSSLAPAIGIPSITLIPSIQNTQLTRRPSNCKTIDGKPCLTSTAIPTILVPQKVYNVIPLIGNCSNNNIIIEGTNFADFFQVNCSKSVTLRGNGGGDEYRILPQMNVVINITDFNLSTDLINLQAFPMITKLSDLILDESLLSLTAHQYSNNHHAKISQEEVNSLTSTKDYICFIFPWNNQKVIIYPSANQLNNFQLNSSNFIFYTPNPSNQPSISSLTSSTLSTKLQILIILPIVFVCSFFGMIFYYCGFCNRCLQSNHSFKKKFQQQQRKFIHMRTKKNHAIFTRQSDEKDWMMTNDMIPIIEISSWKSHRNKMIHIAEIHEMTDDAQSTRSHSFVVSNQDGANHDPDLENGNNIQPINHSRITSFVINNLSPLSPHIHTHNTDPYDDKENDDDSKQSKWRFDVSEDSSLSSDSQ
jgi:hypothetical protein